MMLFYVVSLFVASTAMVAARSLTATTNNANNTSVNTLQAMTTVFALCELIYEVRQLRQVGCMKYFLHGWSLIKLSSSSCLLVGCMCYFYGPVSKIRSVGAFGVAAKWFGLIDYLRSFSSVGSLVRMITVRL
jgi:hypothetical protein